MRGGPVERGLAKQREVQVAYAFDVAQRIAVGIDTFGTGGPAAAADVVREFDCRPAAIIERLPPRPIHRSTTNDAHSGRPGLPWEA